MRTLLINEDLFFTETDIGGWSRVYPHLSLLREPLGFGEVTGTGDPYEEVIPE